MIGENPSLKTSPAHHKKIRKSIAGQVRLYAEKQCKTDEQIAKLFCVAPSTINKTRKEHGIESGHNMARMNREELAIKTWNNTQSTAQVAKELGTTIATARNMLHRLTKQMRIGGVQKLRTNKERKPNLSVHCRRKEAGVMNIVSEIDAKNHLERLFWSRVGSVKTDLGPAYCVHSQVKALRDKRKLRGKAMVT